MTNRKAKARRDLEICGPQVAPAEKGADGDRKDLASGRWPRKDDYSGGNRE
jgi:hypothetical protein